MEKFTIKDIANLAEVSTATVSNFLNGNYEKMSATTRAKLAEIINKADYHPSTTARNLAKNENKTIGVSVADITNPFTSPVISGISAMCEKYGYRMVFTDSRNDEKREIENINRLRQEEVAGFIIDPVNPDNELYNQLSNRNTVIVDRQARRTLVDTVVTDNTRSVETMTDEMKRAGYDELYFVTWPLQGISTRIDRYRGFNNATGYLDDTHLLTMPYNYVPDETSDFSKKIANIMTNKEKRVGFFSMNSGVLLHLLKIMQMQGFEYNTDYGVATYEEFDWMGLMNPGLSCIRQDSYAIGETAMDILKDKVETTYTKEPIPVVRTVPTEIVLRESF